MGGQNSKLKESNDPGVINIDNDDDIFCEVRYDESWEVMVCAIFSFLL